MSLFALIAIAISLALCLIVFLTIFFRQPKFGRLPSGERLHRIEQSPHYVNGHFRNQLATPMLAPQMNRWKVYLHFLFGKKERPCPPAPLPSTKTDLINADSEEDFLVWLGHSSYYLQLNGLRVLVDPVLSKSASPFSFVTRAFPGTNPYTPADFPAIDCLLLTHDHWDHLNKPTLEALQHRLKLIICPLGVGAHLEHWGIARSKIREGDWGERFVIGDGRGEVHICPARHFSGRSLWGNNQSLWASFALIAPAPEAGGEQAPVTRVYFGGDGGFGPHFKALGDALGPFDLVALENGQYNPAWPYVHMQPEESWQAALDLRAKAYLPGHSAKFVISNHPWDEPLERVWQLAEAAQAVAEAGGLPRLVTPLVGEKVWLDKGQKFSPWWRQV